MTLSADYDRSVAVLDSLLRRLLSTGWDDVIRRQAEAKAAWLATFGAKDAPKRARAVGRGIVSLPAPRDELPPRPLLGQRLLEPLDLPREETPADALR